MRQLLLGHVANAEQEMLIVTNVECANAEVAPKHVALLVLELNLIRWKDALSRRKIAALFAQRRLHDRAALRGIDPIVVRVLSHHLRWIDAKEARSRRI